VITVRFFARIREQLGVAELQWPAVDSVQDLIGALVQARGVDWGNVLQAPQTIVAINQQVGSAGTPLADGDEVAFFPPVTGG
jgi:molybdopterin synthase sulfur carrier subunit